MIFRKYQHVEKFGSDEVDGIEIGRCYVFPKIDGTNASLWWAEGPKNVWTLHAGSRTRELTLENDNAGFFNWCVVPQRGILSNRLADFFKANPTKRLYGEWLVKHSLQTYKDEAWRRFYVFDVTEEIGDSFRYLPYEEYQPLMEEYSIDYIPPIIIINNPTIDRLTHQLSNNNFLIQDGKGAGEGVVIKNYDFVNKYGRTTWAKIVTSEFKEKHAKVMGAPEAKGRKQVEQEIVEKYVTSHLCEKVYEKIKVESGWSSKSIPRLLNTVYYDLVREESWAFVKEHKNPTINYSTLMKFTFNKVKEHLPNIF